MGRDGAGSRARELARELARGARSNEGVFVLLHFLPVVGGHGF